LVINIQSIHDVRSEKHEVRYCVHKIQSQVHIMSHINPAETL